MALTDKDFERLEKRFATKGDLSKFATKEDLKVLFNRMFKTFATKQDLENYVTQTEFKEFRNEMLTNFDAVMGELKTIGEEQIFVHHKIYDNHEKRIKKLEVIQNIASS